MRARFHLLAALSVAVLAMSCAPAPPAPAGGRSRLRVVVSIQPQAFFVERIGGDLVSTDVLVAPGQSPATYEPSPRQMAALDHADLLISIGVPFERALLARIAGTLPRLEIVDGLAGIELEPLPGHAAADGHDHGELDPHVWLDPERARAHARVVAAALERRDPEHAADYRQGLAALDADIQRVAAQVAARLTPLAGRELFVFHPAFGYFARRFGLRQVAVEYEGKEPSAQRLAELVDRMREARARAIFVQPEFSRRSAERVAELVGCRVVTLDPLARDYLANLGRMADLIVEAQAP